MRPKSDYGNRTEDGLCTCLNPKCPTHDLQADGLMKKVPCREGEIIVCGFCDRLPCIHLGDRTDRRVECQPCSAKIGKPIFLRLYDCAVHGECIVTRKNIDGVISCRCSDYESE